MPKKVWEKQGVHCLFHYATIESVNAIVGGDPGGYLVSARQHQLKGSGLYVTNIAPGQMPRDKICNVLNTHQRDPETYTGVLVLRRDDSILPVTSTGPHAFVHLAPPGEIIDILPVLVGFGRYHGAAGVEWIFSESCYEVL